jgi:ATP-dependent exoDNAse (exonuclease V) alpha subunit
MALNPKLQAAIDAARERTKQLMEQNKQVAPQAGLPSSVDIADKRLQEQIATSPTLMAMGMNKFDPYEIENVGRANKEQSNAIDLFGLKSESGCLIGPAGTGKTTTMRAIIRAMILSGRIPILSESLAHKYLRGGLPGIYGGSFTRIATRNLRNNCPPDIQANIHTLHRLLEFEPEIFEAEGKKVRLFKPTRNKFRTLPRELVTYLIDETSMVGMRLHGQFIDAIHPGIKPQIIYIGDIAQIPPVMDDPILGYKMLEFLSSGHLVELKEVYRHAGAIVNLANHIRVGNTIPDNRLILPYLGNLRKLPRKLADEGIQKWSKEEDGSKVTIHFWKNRLEGDTGQIRAIKNLGAYERVLNKTTQEVQEHKGFFIKELDNGNYNPFTDMILIPYNKAVGSIELNKHIAHYIAQRDQKEVYEVVAGYQKHYFAVGDKIFHEREEALVVDIKINGLYTGRAYQKEAVTLDRWGHNTAGNYQQVEGQPIDDVEMLLNIDIGNEDEERKNQASHVLHIKKIADLEDNTIKADTISTAAEINSTIFGYALTIHKSQGSQWSKVYCVFHNSHNRNLQRELLYTAITRAQKELYVICEPETFIQGVLSQHIVGNTLEEKAKFFIAKAEEMKKRKDLFDKE